MGGQNLLLLDEDAAAFLFLIFTEEPCRIPVSMRETALKSWFLWLEVKKIFQRKKRRVKAAYREYKKCQAELKS